MPSRKGVCGVGINDADYEVSRDGKICPFYRCWSDMIGRCYTHKPSGKQQSHDGVSVCSDWLLFSLFREWMESQDWVGKSLDKDLIGDVKEYSPEKCTFIDGELNSFIKRPGNKPFGANVRKNGLIVSAGKSGYLGTFPSVEKAHEAWQIDTIKAFKQKADKYEGVIKMALLKKAEKIGRDLESGLETTHF